jgi:hypothetical protein
MNCRLQIADCRLVAAQILVTCLLWPAVAQAQLSAPREAAQIEYGPVSLYPTLQIVDAGKDSNVFDSRDNPQEDYTLTVVSRAFVVAKLKSNELMFSTGSDYVWFRRFKQERSSNGLYSMRFNLSASRFKPFIGAERASTRARPSAEIDVRAQRIERNMVVGTNFNLTERTALTASVNASDSTYEDGQRFRGVDLKESLDRKERSYTGGVRYAVTPLTTVVLGGTYGQSLFPNHLRDAKTYTVGPQLEFSPDAGIRGRASMGIQRFKPGDPALKEFLGITFNAGVNWTLWGRTGFELLSGRNVSYSFKDNEPYYLLTTGRFGVTQKAFGPVDLSAAVERQALSYRFRRGAVAGADFDPDQAARDIVTAGVGIMLGRGFKVVVSGERAVRKSLFDTEANFVRTRLLGTLTIGS